MFIVNTHYGARVTGRPRGLLCLYRRGTHRPGCDRLGRDVAYVRVRRVRGDIRAARHVRLGTGLDGREWRRRRWIDRRGLGATPRSRLCMHTGVDGLAGTGYGRRDVAVAGRRECGAHLVLVFAV